MWPYLEVGSLQTDTEMDYKEYLPNISLLKWGTLGMEVQATYRRDSHHQEPRKAKELRQIPYGHSL